MVPSAQHPLPKHPEKLLPRFDLDNDVSPEVHIKQFMISLRLMDVEHEYVVCRLFMYIFVGKASIWFFILVMRSITSWQQFEMAFMTQFGDDKTSMVVCLESSRIKFNKKEKVKDFNKIFITLLNRIPNKLTKSV